MSVLGIDAINTRNGGTLTHLIELLSSGDPIKHGFKRIIVWGLPSTIAKLPKRDWLFTTPVPQGRFGLLSRVFWQVFELSKRARIEKCDLLFVPGGFFVGRFRPFVAMSQNLLPFEFGALWLYKRSPFIVKLLLLRWAQIYTFNSADGIIFLSRYAKHKVGRLIDIETVPSIIIPHGVSQKHTFLARCQLPIQSYSVTAPYRLLYVSRIELYKHHKEVIKAVDMVRRRNGWPVTLLLIGSADNVQLRYLNNLMRRYDSPGEWIKFCGEVNLEQLRDAYLHADAAVFASSCENLPIILLEKMATGLPIACSNVGVMPEVAGDACRLFDPKSVECIATALTELIKDPTLRMALRNRGREASQRYDWPTSAEETFKFLSSVCERSKTVL